jgi:hypothetical protein
MPPKDGDAIMMTKQNALLAAGVAALVALAGDGAASASDWNWFSTSDGAVGDGIRGGTDSDGFGLWFCRVWYQTGYQPGKVNDALNTCNFPYGGQEYTSAQYEVLVPHWEWTSGGQFIGSPYGAGFDSDGAELYFCLAHYNGGLQLGKFKEGAGCYIAYGGNEYLLNEYALLQDDLPMFDSQTDPADPLVINAGEDAPVARTFALCVANYFDGNQTTLQPGKWIGDDRMCHFSYAGAEVLTQDFSLVILKTIDLFFPHKLFDFVAGQDTNGQPLYLCTTPVHYLDGGVSVQLGKYRKDFDGCHVSWGRAEWDGAQENDPGATPAEALVN